MLGGWPDGDFLDTADTFSCNGGDLDVSLISPSGTPRVSDDVEVLASFGSVTDGGDGMIEVVTISTVVEDTSSVTLEVVVGSIDGNASWSLGDGFHQGFPVVVLDSFVGYSFDNSLVFGIFASLIRTEKQK